MPESSSRDYGLLYVLTTLVYTCHNLFQFHPSLVKISVNYLYTGLFIISIGRCVFRSLWQCQCSVGGAMCYPHVFYGECKYLRYVSLVTYIFPFIFCFLYAFPRNIYRLLFPKLEITSQCFVFILAIWSRHNNYISGCQKISLAM